MHLTDSANEQNAKYQTEILFSQFGFMLEIQKHNRNVCINILPIYANYDLMHSRLIEREKTIQRLIQNTASNHFIAYEKYN